MKTYTHSHAQEHYYPSYGKLKKNYISCLSFEWLQTHTVPYRKHIQNCYAKY